MLALGLTSAWASTLKVLSANQLEIRQVDGETLIILTGQPVRMELGRRLIEADEVIYNRHAGRIQLLGHVLYTDAQGDHIRAQNLVLYSPSQDFQAIEVSITSGNFLLTGPVCEQVAGQILLQEGFLTPCARCGQNPPDYAFEAKEVLLYPGDRIIAKRVWVLVHGQRVFYLPVLLIYLSKRSPKINIGEDPQDGAYFSADLPYVATFGIGFILLRYFETRGWGFGFDDYGVGQILSHYRFLYLPPLPGGQQGIFQYRLHDRLALGNWNFDALIQRDDTSALPYVTNFSLQAANLTGQPTFQFLLAGYLDSNPALTPPPQTPQELPQVTLSFPQGYQIDGLFINGQIQAGYLLAPSNPFDRSALAHGPYLGSGRLVVEHFERYNLPPVLKGFSLNLQNQFTGYYYTFPNTVGELERQVNWLSQLQAQENLGPFSLNLSATRDVIEGQTPFAMDFLRPYHSLLLQAGATYHPEPWFSLGAQFQQQFDAPYSKTLEGILTLNPAPLNLQITHSYDLIHQENDLSSFSLSYTPFPFSLNTSTTYTWQNPLGQRFSPLTVSLSYALLGGSLSFSQSRNLNNGEAISTSFGLSLQTGEGAYTLQETYYGNGNYPGPTDTLSGSLQGIWGPSSLQLSQTITLPGEYNPPSSGAVNFSLSYTYAATTTLSFTGTYLFKGLLTNPLLTFSTQILQPSASLNVQASFHFPEAAIPQAYLASLSFQGGLDLLSPPLSPSRIPGIAFQGTLSAQHNPNGSFSLSLQQFGPSFYFLGPQSTSLLLGVFFSQSLSYPPATSALEPEFVMVYNRCCWALELDLNTQNQSVSLSLSVNGQSAGFLLDEKGIGLIGNNLPSPIP